MKILDRYLIKEFILPFAYCSLAFFILYLVADLFENMDEFLKTQTPWLLILSYYAYMLPMILIQTAPFSLVLGLIFELGQFARHREIIGMKASGIAPKRIAQPLLVLGMGFTALFFMLSEFVLPRTNMMLDTLKRTYLEKSAKQDAQSHQNLTYSNVKENYVLYIQNFNFETNTARNIQIQYFSPSGSIKKVIRARTARYLDQEWWLLSGNIVRYDENGEMLEGAIKFPKQKIQIFETPKDLLREEKAFEQMNFPELKLSLQKKYGRKIPPTQLVQLHSKLSAPWICFIFVLMVVPFGLNIPRGGAFTTIGKAILLSLLFYGTQFMAAAMGKQNHIQPILSCWLPNTLFGGLGMILWGRLR